MASKSTDESTPQAEASQPPNANPNELTLTIQHHGKAIEYAFPSDATLLDLSSAIAESLSIPESNQKFLITPKPGLQKAPFKPLPLRDVTSRKITLMGSTTAEISKLDADIAKAHQPRRSPIPSAAPARTRDPQRARDEAMYTFHTLRPLPYLPNPQRSLRFLERLRDDPGIKTAMRTHKFSVPLLTEMDPAMHTTQESRTLGLNRNGGEVIELRLRTDAYDGYRDYKVIRNTLCHELAHNVHGPHDRNFWDLCHKIEKEVERNDWSRGGHSLSNQEFYNPSDTGDDVVHDHGGWTGGEFVLGGGSNTVSSQSGSTASSDSSGLSRREILARAAEERMKKAGDSSGAGAGTGKGGANAGPQKDNAAS